MPYEKKVPVKNDLKQAILIAANQAVEPKTEEEIIQENLKELLDKKAREERKANGRLAAVIVALLVIFLAIYHAWIRKSGVVAGILVPATIMLSYGGWVVIWTKRDKRKKALLEKHLEEVALKNKTEPDGLAKDSPERSIKASTLHYENEKTPLYSVVPAGTRRSGEHRKYRKEKHRREGDTTSVSSGGSRQSSSRQVAKELRPKRPSIRQKVFRQKETTTDLLVGQKRPLNKKKKLQRLNALTTPQPVIRTNSAP